MNRRDFLKRMGMGGAAISITCLGLFSIGSLSPNIDQPEFILDGENQMENKKVLVTYATKSGSTAEVAEFIGNHLYERGLQVDVLPVGKVRDVNKYDAIVVGSPIRMDKWLAEAADFVKDNKAAIAEKPSAFFTLCLPELAKKASLEAAYADYRSQIEPIHKPDEMAFFPGKLDQKKLSFLDRMIVKMMKAEDMDKRDWTSIEQWSENLITKFGLSG